MGQSPEELRNEITQTRQGMTGTLEAIGDHVSPGRMIERRKNRIANGLQAARDRVMGTAGDAADALSTASGSAADATRQAPEAVMSRTQGSPLGAGAVAFGLGFVAAAVFPPSRRETEAASQLMEKAEPLTEELTSVGREVMDDLKEPVREAVESVKETATSGTEQIKATAQEAAHRGGTQAEHAADQTSLAHQPPPAPDPSRTTLT